MNVRMRAVSHQYHYLSLQIRFEGVAKKPILVSAIMLG